MATAAMLAACGPGRPALIDHTAGPPPRTVSVETEAKTVRLGRIIVDLKHGQHMGLVRFGWGCGYQAPLVWTGSASFFDEKELARAFNDELAKANYPVVGDPNALFGGDEERPDLIVSGRMTTLRANFCHPFNDDEARGETAVAIEWQVFEPNERRIIYKTTTRGSSELDTATELGRHVLFYRAVAEATRGLLADARYHAIITSGQNRRAPLAVDAVFRLHARPAFNGTITQNMPEVQAATVTVLTGGGHGSGFFISSDGFLLTNAHVVGDAKFVRVRLASGREIAGETITVNRVRDVALLKVAEAGFTALPIATGEPQIGSDIYAVGAPLDRRYATTVTRGIVSAYRVEDGVRMIQGDVATQQGNSGGPLVDGAGNVVGITVGGIYVRGVSSSIKFFIPILDGLKGAGLELGESRVVSQIRMLDKSVASELQPGRPPPVPAKPAGNDAPPSPPAIVASLPADSQIAEPAQPPQQAAAVTSLAAAGLEGEYRSAFRADTLQGGLSFDLSVSVAGETIIGGGNLRGARGAVICRAVGALTSEQEAWIAVDCPANRTSYYLQLKGRFTRNAAGVWQGNLAYTSNSGATGEAIFRQ